ncbi:metallophosphoesterase [Burkholderia gladioli]|uniref:metallophosphoesterase n=1 Tax=Burkholderia gladioli TaxID=28095 RepID=UPI003B512677
MPHAKPYALVSDQHFHSWNKFNTVNENGINSRLQYQLNELKRAADELRAAGGNLIINAGDTFHVRGSLAPSVLNPVLDLHRALVDDGFEIIVLAGNHDLEGKDAARLTSAATSLESVGCRVISSPDPESWIVYGNLVMVPWFDSVAMLKEKLEALPVLPRGNMDLILHAPVDGVILGIPDHGLTGDYLAGLGFRRVFSGHYHNHKEIVPGKVWSIGATTHQTWSDINTKAGFLLVGEDVKWRKSHAPEFVQIAPEDEEEDVMTAVPGNYVRAFIDSQAKTKDVAEVRALLESYGAKGVVLIPAPKAGAARAAGVTAIASTGTLEESVTAYVNAQDFSSKVDVAQLCASILNQARLEAAAE